MKPTDRFLCPRCGLRSDFKTRCPTCDVPMVDADTLAPWGVHGLATEWTLPPRWGLVVALGALGGVGGTALSAALTSNVSLRVIVFLLLATINMVLLAQAVPAKWRERAWGGTVGIAGAVVLFNGALAALVRYLENLSAPGAVLFGCLGIALGMLLAAMNSVHLTRRARCDPDASTFTTASPNSIHNAPEGPVRVSGRVRVTRFAALPDGTPCAAFEQRIAAGRSVSIRTGGGMFELDDGSGSSARVLGEWVRVLDGASLNAVAVLPDGAQVEVVGEGRWITGDDPSAPLRGSTRVLEITGSSERPVLLRTLQRATAPSQGVRIATTPSARDEDAEAAMDAAVGPAQEAKSSREGS